MDEAVIQYYRRLLKTRFEYAGSLENASISLDSVNENVLVCGDIGEYMNLYVNVINNIIDDIKYLCVCNPTANVAIEILCALVKGKTLDEVETITEESFCQVLGSKSEDFQKKVKGFIEFLRTGIARYRPAR